ncbi:MAG: ABC transporter permease [Byssovorax sp.]
MKTFLLLVRLRILDVLRNRSSTAFFLLFPLLLLLALGVMFMNGHPFERRPVAVVSAGADPMVEAAERSLAQFPELRVERDLARTSALGKLRSHMVSAVVVRDGSGLRVLVGPRDALFARGLASALPAPPAVEIVDVPRWGYVHYLFPGLLTFSALISGLFGMGYVMVRFRQSLFLKKLSVTPLRRSTFVGAQVIARAALSLVQLIVLVAAARFCFDLPLTLGATAWLLVFTLLGLLAFLGVGFALACVIKTEALIVDVINAVTTPLVLFSEIFFPVSELPGPLPAISAALPSTQMVRLIRAVVLLGETDPAPLLPGMALLAGWALGAFAIAMLAFRWNE